MKTKLIQTGLIKLNLSSRPIRYTQYLQPIIGYVKRTLTFEMLILSETQVGCFHGTLYAVVEAPMFDYGS
jgi:hypothetical protein